MVQYIDRRSGAVCEEKVYGGKVLALLYGEGLLTKIFSYTLLPLIAHVPFFSHLYGFFQKRASSRSKIIPFIETYNIDASEFATQDFSSFNEFFIRKLKPNCRPINPDSNKLAMPADGRYLAYPRFDRFFVKGQEFCLAAFLQDRALEERYAHGSMLIARLCPVDYHRFHFPCDGVPSKPRLINGPLYSVNPLALKKRIAILSENKRMITEIKTETFGKIAYVDVGATSVGTIQQTFMPDVPVKKGQEKGYFEFGGSCLVLLFEPGKVIFDQDVVENTEKGFETLCFMGSSLGRNLR
jgi:phosphatidylserine decarboxylase